MALKEEVSLYQAKMGLRVYLVKPSPMNSSPLTTAQHLQTLSQARQQASNALKVTPWEEKAAQADVQIHHRQQAQNPMRTLMEATPANKQLPMEAMERQHHHGARATEAKKAREGYVVVKL